MRSVADADWLVVSPHRDDAVLSCGGLLALAHARGERALVINVCTRYERDDSRRRIEDERALAHLGASAVDLALPDARLRLPSRYGRPRGVFLRPGPSDRLAVQAAAQLAPLLDASPSARVIAPLGIGGHVDHVLVASAVRDLARARSRAIWGFEDQPYASSSTTGQPICGEAIDISEVLPAKLAATLEYHTQIAAFASLGISLADTVTSDHRSGRRSIERYAVLTPGERS